MSLSPVSNRPTESQDIQRKESEVFSASQAPQKATQIWHHQSPILLDGEESSDMEGHEAIDLTREIASSTESTSTSEGSQQDTPPLSRKVTHLFTDDDVFIEEGSESEESKNEEPSTFKKIWDRTELGLKVIDCGLDLVGATAKIAGTEIVSDTIDKIQTGTHVAMGAKAAEEGKFSLDVPKVVEGTAAERYGVGKSMAFMATCISATAQIGSAVTTALGGAGTLASEVFSNSSTIANKAVKDPALLYSYYHGYQKARELPEGTEEEKYDKQVKQNSYLLKAGVKATKMATNVLSIAVPAIGVTTPYVTIPLAVLKIGAAGADAYMTYREIKKS